MLGAVPILRERVVWRKPRKPGGRGRSSVHVEHLTPAQVEGIRSALRELHARYRTWRAVSDAIGIGERTIERVLSGRRRPTPGWALRIAPVLGTTVDSVLGGPCPVCGRCD